MQNLPNWRSILFVPAHVERFIKSAHTRSADAIQLDLEDSVPIDVKEQARQGLAGYTEYLHSKKCAIVIRVNRDLKNCLLDLEAAILPEVSAITLPKVMGPEHICLIDEAMTEIELRKGLPPGKIRLIALIETIDGLASIKAIAKSSPRLAGLALGTEDLSLDGGFDPSEENLFHPAQQLVFAAKSARINAYGFPASIADYSDLNQLTQRIEKAKSMGFDGSFCIHPSQVQVLNKVYQISPTELEQAQKIIMAYDDAISKQRAAVEVDGKMVDLPVVERARRTLEYAQSQHLPE